MQFCFHRPKYAQSLTNILALIPAASLGGYILGTFKVLFTIKGVPWSHIREAFFREFFLRELKKSFIPTHS